MQSIVLEEPGKFLLQNIAEPAPPGKDEAQVRVLQVGICGTDLHAFEGKQPFFSYPRILGHELAVEVIALGPTDEDHDLEVGNRCCVQPYLNCGQCSACRRGYDNCCQNMQVFGVHRDGGMREIINVPLKKLIRADVSNDALALVEMLSIGSHAVRRAGITPGETALVDRRRSNRLGHRLRGDAERGAGDCCGHQSMAARLCQAASRSRTAHRRER